MESKDKRPDFQDYQPNDNSLKSPAATDSWVTGQRKNYEMFKSSFELRSQDKAKRSKSQRKKGRSIGRVSSHCLSSICIPLLILLLSQLHSLSFQILLPKHPRYLNLDERCPIGRSTGSEGKARSKKHFKIVQADAKSETDKAPSNSHVTHFPPLTKSSIKFLNSFHLRPSGSNQPPP